MFSQCFKSVYSQQGDITHTHTHTLSLSLSNHTYPPILPHTRTSRVISAQHLYLLFVVQSFGVAVIRMASVRVAVVCRVAVVRVTILRVHGGRLAVGGVAGVALEDSEASIRPLLVTSLVQHGLCT